MIYSDMSKGNVFRVFLPLESEFPAETVSTTRVIGEELNTPVINYTRPDFNLYTTPRSNESLKQQPTGSMLNNNNPNKININNLTVNQSSVINAADVWCFDKLDSTEYQTLPFSPDSTKSTNSPSGLNSSDLTEESFIFETSIDEPVKYSQDYENFAFVDEINQISKLKEFNTDDLNNFECKAEDDDSNSTYDLAHLEAKTVLYQDTMITGFAPSKMLLDEDSCLETVDNFDDVFMKPEKRADNLQNLSDGILTPAPSPKSPFLINNNNDDLNDCETSSDCFPVNDTNVESSPAGSRLHFEHNYNNPYINRIEETSSYKSISVTCTRSPTRIQEKRSRRVPTLKVTLPKMKTLRQDSINKIEVNTPDITNDILEMEDEKFDLIEYITSSQDKTLSEPTIEQIDVTPAKPESPLDLEAIINAQCPTPTKRRRIESTYESPGSVQSATSDTSTIPTPKRRGRPPKTECTLPSPSMYKHLSESDWKYMEMRNKNNEASRRSRINRKDREHQVESELMELLNEHNMLAEEEKALAKQVIKWRNAVMKLAQI
ncbi:hypothetical protein Bhyg_11985 [Pseudolycoriella hygida]|uniref:BZIP domain-containing protein n=1 Tax=Pseudolycoriella hygida TaxID=35572 RepID=A0A9Q0S0U7_9DIPT|nr:hypothetical protein Bhyg_11985 [Pseudolycoriella hygida]